MHYTNPKFRFIFISTSPTVYFLKLGHLVSITGTISRASK